LFLKVFKGFLRFLYEDQTRKYDPKANGLCKQYLTKDKSPMSEGEEHRVKNDDEVDESHKAQLKYLNLRFIY